MRRLLWIIAVAVLCFGCSHKSEQSQVEEGKQALKTEQKQSINYKKLTQQTLDRYLSKMAESYNNEDYGMIKSYIQPKSEADKYILKKIKTDELKNYEIKSYKVSNIKVSKSITHADVTRIMKSNKTNNQFKKVVTKFDLKYDKKTKTMRIYDFNDQSVSDVKAPEKVKTDDAKDKPATEDKTAEEKQHQAKGDASTCITSRFKSSCEGVSDAALKAAYDQMVANNILPYAPYEGCAQCTIQHAFDIKDGKLPPATPNAAPKVSSMQDAVQMVTDQYRDDVQRYYPEKDITIIGTEPINGSDIQEDAGGKYYKVRAIDTNGTHELLNSFKVYIQTGEVVME